MFRKNKIDPNLLLYIDAVMSGVFTDSDFAQVVRCLSNQAINHPDNFTDLQQVLLTAGYDDLRKYISNILDYLKGVSTFNYPNINLLKVIYTERFTLKKHKYIVKGDSSDDETNSTLFDTLIKQTLNKLIFTYKTALFDLANQYSEMALPLNMTDFAGSYYSRPSKENVSAYDEKLSQTGSVIDAYQAIKFKLTPETQSQETGLRVTQQDQQKQDDLQKVAALFANRKDMFMLLGKLNKELESWVTRFGVYDLENRVLFPQYMLHTKSTFPKHILRKYCTGWASANGFQSELRKIEGFLEPAVFASILSSGTLFKDNEFKGLTHTALAHFWQIWCLTEYAKRHPNWLSCTPVELYQWLGNPDQSNWLGTFEFSLISNNPQHKKIGSFSNVLTFGSFLTSDECKIFPVLYGLTMRSEKRKEIAQTVENLRLSAQ